MFCIEIKWWDPATIVQFFLPPSPSYYQPGMLQKAIAKLVSCGTAVFNWEWDWFPSWLFSEEGKPQFNFCFSPQWSEKEQGARGNNSFNQPHTNETKGIFFCCTARRGGVWLAFRLCSISLWERGLLQSLLSYGACYWQRFQLTLAENKSIPLNNIIHFPCLLLPLSVPHPEHMCCWHRVNTVTSSEYA